MRELGDDRRINRDIVSVWNEEDVDVRLDLAREFLENEVLILHFSAKFGGLEYALTIPYKGRDLGRLRRTYWDVAPGKPLALIGSSGLLEVAVRDGSAAQELGIRVGDEVAVEVE